MSNHRHPAFRKADRATIDHENFSPVNVEFARMLPLLSLSSDGGRSAALRLSGPGWAH